MFVFVVLMVNHVSLYKIVLFTRGLQVLLFNIILFHHRPCIAPSVVVLCTTRGQVFATPNVVVSCGTYRIHAQHFHVQWKKTKQNTWFKKPTRRSLFRFSLTFLWHIKLIARTPQRFQVFPDFSKFHTFIQDFQVYSEPRRR